VNAPAQLETQRLVLRPWRETDIDGYAELCADESARFIGGQCGREDAWRRMAAFVGHWTLRGHGLWAIEEKAGARFLGFCGLWYPLGWPEREMGWALLPGARGRGYATEAAFAARKVAYDALGWPTLVSFIASENEPSRRVAERLGARFEAMAELRGQPMQVFRHPGPMSGSPSSPMEC
jgi:RimJ/RimL family protein N-acetyltransferase